MVSIPSTLPDNLEELKEKVISLQESNNHFEVENNILREEVRLLRAQLFGRKTEKSKSVQESTQALLPYNIEKADLLIDANNRGD